MYLHHFIYLTLARTRWVIYPAALVLLLSACALPIWDTSSPRDCDGGGNVHFKGKVLDDLTNQPISNAKVLIKSHITGKCPSAIAMKDMELTTDQNGVFTGTIPFMYQDEFAEISVSAPGYRSRVVTKNVNLSAFTGPLTFTLFPESTKTP
ncbi:MAG: carboxypeptidase-like regulatory domain-containing protein [Chloroflexota bacterium]